MAGAPEPRVYKDEVLGRRVSILFHIEDTAVEAFYDGQIRAVNTKFCPEDGTVQTKHYILFDDGDDMWFDLAEKEEVGHLKWIGRDRKPEANKETAKPAIKKAKPGSATPTTTASESGADKKKSSKKRTSQSTPVTPERANKKKTTDYYGRDWVDDMCVCVTTVPHGHSNKVVSEPNAKSVIRQVRKLASGEGITYKQWPDGIVFYHGWKVDLDFDFEAMRHQAVEFEKQHGEDKGHGWLLKHPITKLKLYQAYLEGERA